MDSGWASVITHVHSFVIERATPAAPVVNTTRRVLCRCESENCPRMESFVLPNSIHGVNCGAPTYDPLLRTPSAHILTGIRW